MSESHNGQSQIQRSRDCGTKPIGRFTGQRLKVLRPDTYRRVVELLAEPREHVPYHHICRSLHVSEHTVYAIEKAESVSIAERKEALLRKSLRIANKAIDRVEDGLGEASFQQAAVVYGIVADKVSALSQTSEGFDSSSTTRLQSHLQPRDVAGEFNTWLHQIQAVAQIIDTLPPEKQGPPKALLDSIMKSGPRELPST